MRTYDNEGFTKYVPLLLLASGIFTILVMLAKKRDKAMIDEITQYATFLAKEKGYEIPETQLDKNT